MKTKKKSHQELCKEKWQFRDDVAMSDDEDEIKN